MSKKLQQMCAFVFGVVFVSVLLLLAVLFPEPTDFQYTVFRVVLALAAAGVSATVPGFIEVTIPNWVRAGGALAVFVIVFFYNPADLVAVKEKPNPTAEFKIAVACILSGEAKINTYNFPFADIEKNSSFDDLFGIIKRLPNQQCDQSQSTIYRMQDQKVVLPNGSLTATSRGNLGVIVLPPEVIEGLGGSHLAFTKVHSFVRQK